MSLEEMNTNQSITNGEVSKLLVEVNRHIKIYKEIAKELYGYPFDITRERINHFNELYFNRPLELVKFKVEISEKLTLLKYLGNQYLKAGLLKKMEWKTMGLRYNQIVKLVKLYDAWYDKAIEYTPN